MASDFVLLLVTFFLSGVVRSALPFGSAFAMKDVYDFYPMGILYAIVMVACYWAKNNYDTLHIRSIKKELIDTIITNLVGFAIVATYLFAFQLSQFSRLWLGVFYIASVLVIVLKRAVCDKLATRYIKWKKLETNVLLIGSGNTARRVYSEIIGKHTASMNYVGYLAATESNKMDNYLGPKKNFHEILQTKQIDLILIAEETQKREELQNIISVANSYQIRVCVIPVYNDFISSSTDFNVINGLQLVDVTLLNTCNIMGVNIVVTDMDKTMNLIEQKLEDWRGKYICVANVHTTVTAHDDESYRKIQNSAVMALPDGSPLSQFSREQGHEAAQRVTGPDLMQRVLSVSAEKGWKNYFYGSTPETLETLNKKVAESYPGTQVVGMMSPPFRELTPQEDAEIIKEINATKPDFVWVGLGAPKQERWMAAHEGRVQALMVGVGAAFDYEAGNIKRAPQWMQKLSMEWLYRLMQDPKRLFKRYFETNTKFLLWKWKQ